MLKKINSSEDYLNSENAELEKRMRIENAID